MIFMVVSHHRSRRTPTTSIYRSSRGRRLAELGSAPALTKIGEKRVKTQRTKGGNSKIRLLSENVLNLYDAKTKKHEKVNIISVVESPADINYVRRNILVKGTLVETEKGKAKITNRPGQEGTINGVLVQN